MGSEDEGQEVRHTGRATSSPARGFSLRALHLSDLAFYVAVGGMTAFVAALFWIPTCLTLQDYNQFLVFARAARDIGNPSSPFHGTYCLAPWYTPTSLPTQLTAALSLILPGGIESAGKLLLSLHVVVLVGASSFLLRELQRPRWCVVLVFPLFYNVWIFGGFFAFATASAWIVLGLALAIRWFRLRTLGAGLALAACLVVVFLWHGIAYAALGLGVGILWFVARFPRWRDRVIASVPTLPSLALFFVWKSSTFDAAASNAKPPEYVLFWDAVEQFAGSVAVPFDHSAARVWAFIVLVLATQLAPSQLVPTRSAPSIVRSFRVHNPMLLIGAAYLIAYFKLPLYMYRVEGLSNRFAYFALLCLVFAWRLPRAPSFRAVMIGATLALGFWTTHDLMQRMRKLDEQTRGASALIDRLQTYDTLYYSPPNRGSTAELVHPLIELEQIATARKGGLPNTSFAGYGYTYVRFVDNRNPMPGLSGFPQPSAAMRRFDYVLATDDEPRPSPTGFRYVARSGRWSLYGVCGSRRFPTCD